MKLYEHLLNAHEGWDLFYCEGGEASGEYQIQRIDAEDPKFPDDKSAIQFVLAKACEGSKRHLNTLHELWDSPKEKDIVKRVAGGIGLKVDLPEYEHQLAYVWPKNQ